MTPLEISGDVLRSPTPTARKGDSDLPCSLVCVVSREAGVAGASLASFSTFRVGGPWRRSSHGLAPFFYFCSLFFAEGGRLGPTIGKNPTAPRSSVVGSVRASAVGPPSLSLSRQLPAPLRPDARAASPRSHGRRSSAAERGASYWRALNPARGF
ncbi:unnamed protein product [Lampetra fluviatilis]